MQYNKSLQAEECVNDIHDSKRSIGEPQGMNDDVNSITALMRFLSSSKYFKDQFHADSLQSFSRDPSKWVSPTIRMIHTASVFDNANDLICLSHHVRCAIDIIGKLEKDPSKKLVLFGHKWQGKSQLLYFFSELLQSLNEKVIYLDDSFSLEAGKLTSLRSRLATSGKWWSSLKTKISKDGPGSRVHQLYDLFEECLNAQHASEYASEPCRWAGPAHEIFVEFLYAVTTYVRNSGGQDRVWLIIDEVTNNKDYLAAYLPAEQKRTDFHTIVTGSASMGSFITRNNLQKWVYDFPLFSAIEMHRLADKLNDKLIARGSLSLYEAIRDVSASQPNDWIQDNFAGIPGYLVELGQHIAEGNSLGDYSEVLTDRLTRILESLSEHKLKTMKESLARGKYFVLQDIGLCGSHPPSGLILRLLLQYVLDFHPDLINRENDLCLINAVLGLDEVLNDGKIRGTLMELKTLLQLEQGWYIRARPVSSSATKTTEQMLPGNLDMGVCLYDRTQRSITICRSPDSEWLLLKLPVNFPVVDVMLLQRKDGYVVCVWGIQITASSAPYEKHRTFTKFESESRLGHQLDDLFIAIDKKFGTRNSKSIRRYVMHAPLADDHRLIPTAPNDDMVYASNSLLEQFAKKRKRG